MTWERDDTNGVISRRSEDLKDVCKSEYLKSATKAELIAELKRRGKDEKEKRLIAEQNAKIQREIDMLENKVKSLKKGLRP